MVLKQGLALALIGVGVGVIASFALARLIQGLLHGVAPHDPATFSIVPAVLVLVALLASWIPAWRATRVNPLSALRQS